MGITPKMLGRAVDALGSPIDGRDPFPEEEKVWYPINGQPSNPMERPPITEVMELGVRAIDGLLTMGKGQRMGIFAGSGVGKSTLMGMIARNVKADVNVIALVGERGREVVEFIDRDLGPEGMARTVLVVATSDQPAMMRSKCALTATAIAEYFRDQGMDVLLMMDSLTRFCMAQREIGLAAGEPPVAVVIPRPSMPLSPSCSSVRATSGMAPSPESTPSWWKVMIPTNPFPIQCAVSWTDTSSSPVRWRCETTIPPLIFWQASAV